jgi:hypothetical protein
LSISGLCNRCGTCCKVGEFVCTNLQQTPDKLETTCLVYRDRYPNMPIIMRRLNGDFLFAECAHETAEEEIILTGLIKQGKCSLVASE